ncbi:MAG: beta-propeller domain-containing protein [Polyangiales bacterium]
MGGVARFKLSTAAFLALVVGCSDEGASGPTHDHGGSDTAGSAAPGSPSDPGSPGNPSSPAPSAGSAAPGSPGNGKPGAKPPGTPSTPNDRTVDEPLSGTTDFESADLSSGGSQGGFAERDSAATPGTAAPTAPSQGDAASGAGPSTGARGVERGDIYRLLGDQRILNLNTYRGIQLIDVRDSTQPKVEGRLAVSGDPVELYVTGDRAVVLLNNWRGYYGERDDVQVESVYGGLVMTVDITDRAHPELIDQVPVPGYISTSRLTQGDSKAALYVAATSYDGQQKAVVKSFDVSDGKLTEKSELDLGGYVQDVQATTDVLLVASNDYNKFNGRSEVFVIDISSPDGTMVRGGSVVAQGIVQNKFNLDAYNGVLRVVSGSNWNGLSNQVETFSLKNLQQLEPLDSCTFGGRDPMTGQSEQLFATLFVENRAFFVTYYRVDPFHAFEIADDGTCTEHAEFIVSGWNDFFRATLDNTRLIGIGHNDANNTRKLSVSLYDAVDLTNPAPLKARQDIDLEHGYSDATWDDRGFSVIEDAVSVTAEDGTTETGLVLLPYQGWDQDTQESVAEVQLFTFSDHTLTKRGTLDHGSPVKRSFEAKASTTANLSDEQLSLFDTRDPDAPAELGRVDIAPNYSEVFVYGDHIARVRQTSGFYGYSPADPKAPVPQARVQILARSADVDGDDVLATFEVPAAAELIQVDNLLVSVFTQTTYDPNGVEQPKYATKVQVFDLTDPVKPVERGSLETDRIQPSFGGIYPPFPGGPAIDACFDCRGGSFPLPSLSQHFVVGQAIAFVNTASQQESLGEVKECYTYANGVGTPACTVDPSGNTTCGGPQEYYSGGINCITPKGGEETCSGQFYLCDEKGCKEVEPPSITTTNCNTYEQFRYWTSYAFDALDLRDPAAPALADRLELPKNEEGTSVIAAGDTVYFNHQKPLKKDDDARRYVKRYVRLIGFADPAAPTLSDSINVPGDVIAAFDETLYTRDYIWKDDSARTRVARLRLEDNLAHLQADHVFEDQSVSAVKLDGAGHILVSSDPSFGGGGYPGYPAGRPVTVTPGAPGTETPPSKLSILDEISLETLGEADVDSWATFKDAQRGRALYQVSGGLLVFDVQDPAAPKAQAYFPTSGWPSEILFDGDSILFAAGSYGVYRFDASVFNLLTP